MKQPVVCLLLLFTSMVCMAGEPVSDTAIIRQHLIRLTHTTQPRSYAHTAQLDSIAAFIRSVFATYSDSVSIQQYPMSIKSRDSISTTWYQNVVCSFGTENEKRIVIGAHYDVCELNDEEEGDIKSLLAPGNPHTCRLKHGADDNASGITGLLELARMLKGQKLKYRVDLVAYTLEEPPFFRTVGMGSYIHAQSLLGNKADVYGMVALEMIGYFRDEKKSQKYPLKFLSLFYGNKGNYITLVRKNNSGKFARQFCQRYRSANTIRTKKFTGPARLPGIDFSDHLNYWEAGYSALMITDTAFYRNPNYHTMKDTMETLDLARMAKVIDGVYAAVVAM